MPDKECQCEPDILSSIYSKKIGMKEDPINSPKVIRTLFIGPEKEIYDVLMKQTIHDVVEKLPELEDSFSINETDAERALREDVPILEFMFIAQCKYCDELLLSDPVGMIDMRELKWSA